jgi:hypothetical protein
MVSVSSGATDALRFHRQVLQHLQWNTGKRRWVCKGTTAQHHLHALFEVFPDALCVWSHRPLGEIYASNVAFRAAVYDAINGKAMDWSRQSREVALRTKAAVDRAVASAVVDDPRVLHVPFRELADDPIAVVRKIYARRGVTVTSEYEARLGAWLNDPENQIDRYGRYPYSYEPFGLDKKWIQQLFADYSRRFGLEDA